MGELLKKKISVYYTLMESVKNSLLLYYITGLFSSSNNFCFITSLSNYFDETEVIYFRKKLDESKKKFILNRYLKTFKLKV